MSILKHLFGSSHHDKHYDSSHHGGHHGSSHHSGYASNPYAPTVQPVASATSLCAKCQSNNLPNAKFCQQCGTSMLPGACFGCNQILAAGAKFCGQSGKAV